MDEQKQVMDELRKNPKVAHLGLACMILFGLAVVLFPLLKGLVDLLPKYIIVAALHTTGLIAGLFSLHLCPENLKTRQSNVRLVMILNGAFSILFGYKLVMLIMRT